MLQDAFADRIGNGYMLHNEGGRGVGKNILILSENTMILSCWRVARVTVSNPIGNVILQHGPIGNVVF